jgi:hypothetical protein
MDEIYKAPPEAFEPAPVPGSRKKLFGDIVWVPYVDADGNEMLRSCNVARYIGAWPSRRRVPNFEFYDRALADNSEYRELVSHWSVVEQCVQAHLTDPDDLVGQMMCDVKGIPYEPVDEPFTVEDAVALHAEVWALAERIIAKGKRPTLH